MQLKNGSEKIFDTPFCNGKDGIRINGLVWMGEIDVMLRRAKEKYDLAEGKVITVLVKNGEEVDIREIPAIIGGDESRRAGIVLAKSNLANLSKMMMEDKVFGESGSNVVVEEFSTSGSFEFDESVVSDQETTFA